MPDARLRANCRWPRSVFEPVSNAGSVGKTDQELDGTALDAEHFLIGVEPRGMDKGFWKSPTFGNLSIGPRRPFGLPFPSSETMMECESQKLPNQDNLDPVCKL
jgi:hypothetical protein